MMNLRKHKSQREHQEKVAARLIDENLENKYISTPNTILEVNKLTNKMGHIHIANTKYLFKFTKF